MSRDLYQIGLPAANLSTVFMLWVSFGRPGIIVIHPSKKNDERAVIELRDKELAAEIVETVKTSQVKIIQTEGVKRIEI